MSLTKLSVAGFYLDYPVDILIDGSMEESRIAFSFVCRGDVSVPRTVLASSSTPSGQVTQAASGPVFVQTRNGFYRSAFRLTVASINGHDIVLGGDWIRACQCHVVGGEVVDPPLGAALSAGHEWYRKGLFDSIPSPVMLSSGVLEMSSWTTSSVETKRDDTTGDMSSGSSQVASSSSFVWSSAGQGSQARSAPLPSSGSSSVTSVFPASSTVVGSDDGTTKANEEVADVSGLTRMDVSQLMCNLRAHGIDVAAVGHSASTLRAALVRHISMGECVSNTSAAGCRTIRFRYMYSDCGDMEDRMLEARICYLKTVAMYLNKVPLRDVLRLQNVDCDTSDTKGVLRRKLKALVQSLRKGKVNEVRRERRAEVRDEKIRSHAEHAAQIQSMWPSKVPDDLKDRLLGLFREQTSSNALREFTCGCCGAACPIANREVVVWDDEILHKLHAPDDEYGRLYCTLSALEDTPLQATIVCENGVDCDKGEVALCSPCLRQLRKGNMPPLALANGMWIGPVPKELEDLTQVEESMIALCRARCTIFYLKNDGEDEFRALPNMQRSLKGNVIEYPQKPGRLLTVLPPPVGDILTSICVIFVGSSPPSKEWLLSKAKPLAVRRERVRRALEWLKAHNRLYRDIEIDQGSISALPENGPLPYDVEFLQGNAAVEASVARYDGAPERRLPEVLSHPETGVKPGVSSDGPEMAFPSVVITDVDANAPAHVLRAAAVKHFKEKKGGYVQIPHGSSPMNEFCDPSLFPMLYPTLFPYGVGGLEDRTRVRSVSLKRHASHLLRWADPRFQRHSSFLFVVFNILQRREVLLRSSLKVQKESFARVAEDFRTVSMTAVSSVCNRLANKESLSGLTEEEKKVLALMKEVDLVTSSLPGSSSARLSMRNQLRGMMVQHGLPSFYLTINPADVYNPIVKFLAGSEIDLDNMKESDLPDYWTQSVLVAKNPFIAAKFFNLFMNAFIEVLLGFDKKKRTFVEEGGVFGHVKAYYGCVEAQGRGTLHCHMVIWLEGALNPNEIRDRVLAGDSDFAQRLLAYLDDCISNAIPEFPPNVPVPDPESRPHSCHLRGVDLSLPKDVQDLARRADMHYLVRDCQKHKHSATCWKYCKPGEPKTCRFDLDPKNVCEKSHFDVETGDLCLRCIDGMVNNFNATILEAMRCNMDVKFIGSGEAAKAIMYYVTNYITKPQMKAHVAYATLELAINRLSVREEGELDNVTYGKQLLRRCAFSLLTEQELSAQQVASYLTGCDDKFSSHSFQNLYWPSFERYVESMLPSPECYLRAEPSAARTSESSSPTGDLGLQLTTDVNHAPEEGPAPAVGTDEPFESATDTSDYDSESDMISEGDSDDDIISEDDSDDELEDFDVTAPSAVNADPVSRELKELTLCIDDDGALVVKADQVCDYVNRPEAVTPLSVWQYFQVVRKFRRPTGRHDQEFIDSDSEVEGDARQVVDAALLPGELAEILSDSGRRRFDMRLAENHPEFRWKMLNIRHPRDRPVLVPIGPALPRRDRAELRAKYCRLMLTLFKPWRNVEDLRGDSESWAAAFDTFVAGCSSDIRRILDNMQLLHECKDSGIDHFRNRAHVRQMRFGAEFVDSSAVEGDMDADVDEADVLAHVCEQEEQGTSLSTAGVTEDAVECVSAAIDSGLYECPSFEGTKVSGDAAEYTQLADEFDVEKTWQGMYDDRKALRKQKRKDAGRALPSLSVATGKLDGSAFDQAVVQSLDGVQDTQLLAFRDRAELEASIVPGERAQSAVGLSVDDAVEKWTLNAEQARAFRIIAGHATHAPEERRQLRMYLGGAGGTGKSRVINALRDFFESREEGRRFRLSSYTGIASKNIEGMTLHSALCLTQNLAKAKPGSRTHQDLQALWEGVDYLFVDEVSMVGCVLMARISEALCLAKGNSDPFGGVNVIFAGDFAQLPPVGEAKLFGRMTSRVLGSNGESKGHRSILGKLLWLSIDTVVLLRQVMRQSGQENELFVDLLARLRLGRCTREDFRLLRSRVLCRKLVDDEQWSTDAPVVVYDNATKDALNIRGVEAFARSVGQTVEWYYCVDRHKGRTFEDETLRKVLYRQPSGKTQGLLGRIPLVVGMRVIVSKNFDVEGGVLNGSVGTLRSVRYSVDQHGLRHLKSCVVHLPQSSAPSVAGLGDHEFPILEENKNWTVVDKHSKRRLVLSRTQVPIQPAYAITSHRAQGQTYSRVIVDLKGCRGHEAPYVMLSRAKTLEGVLILRPFDMERISGRVDGVLVNELQRLEILNKRTLKRLVQAAGEDQDTSSLSGNGVTFKAICEDIPNSVEERQKVLLQLEQDIGDLIRSGGNTYRTSASESLRGRKRQKRSTSRAHNQAKRTKI